MPRSKPDPTKWMTPEEKIGYVRCQEFAKALLAKGVTAYFGASWDSTGSHSDPTFWHFSPRVNGGVRAFVTYDRGTYDCGFVEPEEAAPALSRIALLGQGPDRDEIWKALVPAMARAKK